MDGMRGIKQACVAGKMPDTSELGASAHAELCAVCCVLWIIVLCGGVDLNSSGSG